MIVTKAADADPDLAAASILGFGLSGERLFDIASKIAGLLEHPFAQGNSNLNKC